MRILLVSHGAGPYGAEGVLIAMAGGLAARGHEVVLEFPHPGPALDSADRLPGVAVRVGGRSRLPRRAAEIPAFIAAAAPDITSIHRLVREIEPDVTWVNSIYSPWAALGARLSAPPVVWHMHERNVRRPAGAVMAAVVGFVAGRVVVVSDYLAREFRRFPWLRHRVRVVRNPLIGSWRPREAEPKGAFRVGYIGQLEPSKRASDVVRAIALLDGARGLIAGDGKARADLEAEVREAGLERRVELAGFQPDVRSCLAAFHCMALPSLGEGFGLVAVEAMASGVPVVAARSGALPEVLGDAALYHVPGDPVDLARQLDRLRRDPALRQELTRRGLARAESFRKDQWLDAIESVLRDVVLERPESGP